jgi:hypothetical protein
MRRHCLRPRLVIVRPKAGHKKRLGHVNLHPRMQRRNLPDCGSRRAVLFRPKTGSALRCFLQRISLQSPRRKRATAFMDGALLDHEAAFLERGAKALVRRGLLRIDPNHQHPAAAEKIPKPVQRRLEGMERATPPIDKCDVILDPLDCRNCPLLLRGDSRDDATPASVQCSSLDYLCHSLSISEDSSLCRSRVRVDRGNAFRFRTR